jgi:hypothetical protein
MQPVIKHPMSDAYISALAIRNTHQKARVYAELRTATPNKINGLRPRKKRGKRRKALQH